MLQILPPSATLTYNGGRYPMEQDCLLLWASNLSEEEISRHIKTSSTGSFEYSTPFVCDSGNET